jgi:hypothetical protein
MRVLLLFALAYCSSLHAQDSTIIIKAGTSFNESVSITDLCEYPQFVYGKVFFKMGDSTTAKFNYHRFSGEMQYIDFKGDTLKITNAATIKFIRINDDVFYYDDGYVKIIKDINGIKLASRQALLFTGKSKIGAHDMASPTSSIDSYNSLMADNSIYKLVPKEDITLTKKTQYYFGDKFNRFILATRKNVMRQFSKQSAALNSYLKENNTDFNSRKDLEQLLQFLVGL